MKTLIITLIVLAIIFVVLFLLIYGVPLRVDTSFATKVHLKNHYNGALTFHPIAFQNLDVDVTDARDVKILKDLLSGWAIKNVDEASFFYDPSLSITLTKGRQTIIFWPCFSKDPFIQIADTHKYLELSEKDYKTFTRILKKYRMVIP